MMTASQISAQIRAKKKEMEKDHSDAVKLSGIPMDATDMEVIKNHEEGERLSENHPKDHSDEPELSSDVSADGADDAHEEMAPDPKLDDEKMKRMAKIKSMMGRMGK